MQGQETPKQNNVVSLFAARTKADGEKDQQDAAQASSEPPVDFENLKTKNERNKERLAKERANANKSVLRSYRIKH